MVRCESSGSSKICKYGFIEFQGIFLTKQNYEKAFNYVNLLFFLPVGYQTICSS